MGIQVSWSKIILFCVNKEWGSIYSIKKAVGGKKIISNCQKNNLQQLLCTWMHTGRLNSQDDYLDFADKRQAFVSLLIKLSRSQKTKNCFCEAYCYYEVRSCMLCWPESLLRGRVWSTGFLIRSSLHENPPTRLLWRKQRFMFVMSMKKRGPITEAGGSVLRHRTSTALSSRSTKHFPNSFYCSGTNLSPRFNQILPATIFLFFSCSEPPCQINAVSLV